MLNKQDKGEFTAFVCLIVGASILCIGSFFLLTQYASGLEISEDEPCCGRTIILETVTPETHYEAIERVSKEEGVSYDMMKYVYNCETIYGTDFFNENDPHGGAVGPYQIILFWHPTVTEECANDAECSARYFAKRYKGGDGHLWTCFRKWARLYG